MTIPLPATDNFYKFFALSGVATAMASGHWYVSKVVEYDEALLLRSDELRAISFITQWGAALGVAVAVAGFAAWFFRVQLPADREARAKSDLAVLQAKEAALAFQSSQRDMAQPAPVAMRAN